MKHFSLGRNKSKNKKRKGPSSAGGNPKQKRPRLDYRAIDITSQIMEQVHFAKTVKRPIQIKFDDIRPPRGERPYTTHEIETSLQYLQNEKRVISDHFRTPTGWQIKARSDSTSQRDGRSRNTEQPAAPREPLVLPSLEETMFEMLIVAATGPLSLRELRILTARSLKFPTDRVNERIGGFRYLDIAARAHDALLAKGLLLKEEDEVRLSPMGQRRVVEPGPMRPDELPKGFRKLGAGQQDHSSRHDPAKASAAAANVLKNIPRLSPDKLVALWKNATKILSDPSRTTEHEAALMIARAVEDQWDRLKPDEHDLFPWPTTEIGKKLGGSGPEGFRSEGMLSYLEYRVGKVNGHAAPVRQVILSRIFEGKLPRVFEPEYMALWGEPGSAMRLRKMAESLAAFARNFKRQDEDRYDEAIRHWEQDLEFLHDRYYVGRFSFGWPSTQINDTALSQFSR